MKAVNIVNLVCVSLLHTKVLSWSLQPLWQLHPAGIHSHTQLLIPDHLSAAAASLLTEVRANDLKCLAEVFIPMNLSLLVTTNDVFYWDFNAKKSMLPLQILGHLKKNKSLATGSQFDLDLNCDRALI